MRLTGKPRNHTNKNRTTKRGALGMAMLNCRSKSNRKTTSVMRLTTNMASTLASTSATDGRHVSANFQRSGCRSNTSSAH